jgi:dihydrofolate reductase
MGRLIYSAITSLDGYVADATGSFDWARPDEEVHAFVNELERPIGTYLYGRRMYEVMQYWETVPPSGDAVEDDYADLWRSSDKVVYSRTLEAATTARTRLERSFDPEAVRALKGSVEHDLSVGGPGLGAEALRAGLVDECHVFLNPIAVGGGNPWLPDGLRIPLDLVDEHRFAGGVVHLQYRVQA